MATGNRKKFKGEGCLQHSKLFYKKGTKAQRGKGTKGKNKTRQDKPDGKEKMLTKTEKEKLKALTLRQVGKKYIFGVEVKLSDADPRAFDCSELIQWLFYQIGYDVPDGSFNQFDAARKIPDKNYDTGDLVFCSREPLKIGHVGMVLKQDSSPLVVVEARNHVVGVVKTTLREFTGRKNFVGIRRPVLKKLKAGA